MGYREFKIGYGNLDLGHKEPEKNDPEISNFCTFDIMAFCTAGDSWKDQEPCKFAAKATTSNRCMYYCEALGGHCDSVDAQMDLR